MINHYKWMNEAMLEANQAFEQDEVPVGAVIVKEGQLVSKAHNMKEQEHTSLGHAEVIAIYRAQKKLKTWDLSDCTLYVTLEPCLMCTGAIYEARIQHIVMGAKDTKGGYFETKMSYKNLPGNKNVTIETGVMQEESTLLLQRFFQSKRNENIKVRRIHDEEWDAYQKLRKEVFVDEQGVPFKMEFDAQDEMESTWHVGAFVQNEIIGTMRLLFPKKGLMIIGRLTVKKDFRNNGVCRRLLHYAEKQARSQNIQLIQLSAQVQAMSFYEKEGFVKSGDKYLDAGIGHYHMSKKV